MHLISFRLLRLWEFSFSSPDGSPIFPLRIEAGQAPRGSVGYPESPGGNRCSRGVQKVSKTVQKAFAFCSFPKMLWTARFSDFMGPDKGSSANHPPLRWYHPTTLSPIPYRLGFPGSSVRISDAHSARSDPPYHPTSGSHMSGNLCQPRKPALSTMRLMRGRSPAGSPAGGKSRSRPSLAGGPRRHCAPLPV